MFKRGDAKTAATAGVPAKPSDEDIALEGFMAEVESDLREDQFKKILKSYGNLIIGLAVALVLGVAGYQVWHEYQLKQHDALANRYDAAITQFDAGKYDEAAKEFAEIAKNGGQGYAALARLQEAAAKLQKGDNAGAVAVYKALGEDKNIDPVFRDLGTLLRVMYAIDGEDAKTLETALAPLIVAGNPYQYSALELAALLAAKQGDTARAAKLAGQITNDPAAPNGVRERASDLETLYKPAETASAATIAPPTPQAPAPQSATPSQGK